jgi:hypothetical protein
VDAAAQACKPGSRRGSPTSSEAIAARRGRSVDVGRHALRLCGRRKELISRELAEPSDGLEPSTPSYHCKSAFPIVPMMPASDRTCSTSCTRLVPAHCCLFSKHTTERVDATDHHHGPLPVRGSVLPRHSSIWCDERRRRQRLASSRSVPSRAKARPVGVDFGRAWLTLEHVRVLGLRVDARAAVAASASTRAPRRRCSCASLRGF